MKLSDALTDLGDIGSTARCARTNLLLPLTRWPTKLRRALDRHDGAP